MIGRPRRRSSSLGAVKKILLSLVVVGLLGSVTYKRVDAVMSSQTTNEGASVASGTLVTGDTVYTRSGVTLTAGTQCKSWTSSWKDNVDETCASAPVIWDVSTTGLRFPGQTGLAYVALQNAGSKPATQLQLSLKCVTSSDTTAPAYVFASTGGAGDPCNGGMDMYVQEVNDFTVAPPTNKTCVYPDNYYTTPGQNCGWTDDTVAGLAGISCWDLGPTAANTTRYFVVGVRLSPTNATNNMQGRDVSLRFKWHLQGGNYTYDVFGNPTGSTCANPSKTGLGQ